MKELTFKPFLNDENPNKICPHLGVEDHCDMHLEATHSLFTQCTCNTVKPRPEAHYSPAA